MRHDILAADIEHLVQTINRDLEAERVAAEGELTHVEADLCQVEQTIGRLVDAIERTGLTGAIEQRLREREAERQQLATRRAHLLALRSAQAHVTAADLRRTLGELDAALLGADVEKARQALQALVARIETDGGEETRIFYVLGG